MKEMKRKFKGGKKEILQLKDKKKGNLISKKGLVTYNGRVLYNAVQIKCTYLSALSTKFKVKAQRISRKFQRKRSITFSNIWKISKTLGENGIVAEVIKLGGCLLIEIQEFKNFSIYVSTVKISSSNETILLWFSSIRREIKQIWKITDLLVF